MKKWLLAAAAVGMLAGCQDDNETTQPKETEGPSSEVEQKIEEALGTDVVIPTLSNHEIGLAYLEEGVQEENQTSAHLIYQTTKKPMEGLTAETWGKQNDVEVLHGELFKDAPLVELDIYPETYGTLDNAEKREIAGEEVDYSLIPGSTRSTAYIGFDKEGAGYMIQYHLAQNQSVEEAFSFAEQIIEGLN